MGGNLPTGYEELDQSKKKNVEHSNNLLPILFYFVESK
jgi:hypothetical protein